MKYWTIERAARIGKMSMGITLFFYHLSNKNVVGKCFFSAFKTIMYRLNKSVLTVVNADKYRDLTKNVDIKTIEINRKGVTANIIMAGSDANVVMTEKEIPDLRVKVFNNVCIRGNSDVVVDKQNLLVVSEEAYNVEDYIEIIDGLLYRTSENICILRDNLHHPLKHIASGIMISGKFCDNYYHLLYENFNRLIYLEQVDAPDEVPIIIDRRTLEIPSCKRIFELLTDNSKRDYITIEPDVLYLFDKLYCIDHVNRLPPHLKDPNKPAEALYSPKALSVLRSNLLQYKEKSGVYPKRFFISRANAKRRHFNEEEVFSVLRKYDFVRLAPEDYSFEEQISLFYNAELIVAGSGAAFSNLLFVNDKCRIICFGRSTSEKVSEMACFNTLANLNGAVFYYFPRKEKAGDNVHVNFEIDCYLLEKTISQMLK